jgi:hypothetical protein
LLLSKQSNKFFFSPAVQIFMGKFTDDAMLLGSRFAPSQPPASDETREERVLQRAAAAMKP